MRSIIFFAVVCVLFSAFVCVTTAHSRHKFPFDLWRQAPSDKDCGCTTDPKQQCGCCFNLNSKILKINDSACFNITYVPDEKGAQFTFQWDGKTYLNETLSARNPPPLCSEVPVGFVGMVGVCVKFSNLSWTKEKFGGCMEFQLKLIVKYWKFDLGCYYTKSEQLVARLENSVKELHFPELQKVRDSQNVDVIHIEQFRLQNFRHRPNGGHGHIKKEWLGPFPEVYKESNGNKIGPFPEDGYGVGKFPDEKMKADGDNTFPDEEEPVGIVP